MTPRFTDLTGKTLAGLLVLRHIGLRQVRCRCACTAEFVTSRDFVIRKDRADEIATCPECLRKIRAERARGNRAWKAKRRGETTPRKGRHCLACENLPWRRPVGGHCPKCHEPHGYEALPRATDILDSYAAPGRVWPEGGV
jgi:hypothetical protein